MSSLETLDNSAEVIGYHVGENGNNGLQKKC